MATNNNLIPINIKDLPKLDILSNSDLILIETVEGTATILYRDFIIDEAHTTFAATLSASVTSAINLSAAIDTTNATVKTVSASLYSSITALSSYSTTYSNALSSQLTALNATVITLSTNVNTLSTYSTTNITTNTSNIVTLSSNVQTISAAVASLTSTGLSSRGTIIGSNTPFHYILPGDRPASATAADDNFFDPAVTNITLLPNKKYTIDFNIFYLKTTTGTMTFTLSGTQTVANGVASYTITPLAGMQAQGAVTGAGVLNATGSDIELPATGSLTTAVNHNASIQFTVESNLSNASIVKLVARASAGTYTPKRGSMFRVVQID